MITLFENYWQTTDVKKIASLFFNKICEYDNNIDANTYYNRGDFELEFNTKKGDCFFTLIITEELTLIIKNKFNFENNSFSVILIEYLKNSEYFRESEMTNFLGKKFEILGTPEEIEEDLKNLEAMIQANKYNL